MNIHRLTMGTIDIPEVYVCRDQSACDVCREAGLPYIKWFEGTDEELIISIMLPILERTLPKVDWDRVLNLHDKTLREVIVITPGGDQGGKIPDEPVDYGLDGSVNRFDPTADIADDLRRCGGLASKSTQEYVPVSEFMGDDISRVDIEQLQELGMLPHFIGEIDDVIRMNLSDSMMFRDSYNKRLDACLGNFDSAIEKPNLIILDVSWSIPFGIADTMLKLIDTLRDRANADLIVHADRSYFWKSGEVLPSPKKLREMCPTGQEAWMFHDIVRDHLAGKSYGTVISFGDDDAPWADIEDLIVKDAEGFSCERLICFHTRRMKQTGFTLWITRLDENLEPEFNCDWARVIEP